MLLLWLAACGGGDFDAELVPSEYVPGAGRIVWNGPGGHATLTVDGGVFASPQVVSEADVDAGEASLPFTLVPAGSWHWQVQIDDGDRVWRSRSEAVDVPDPPDALGHPHLERSQAGKSQLAGGGYWVGYHFGYPDTPEAAIPFVLDGEGRVVWWIPAGTDGYRAMRVKPSDDGRDVLVLEDNDDGSKRRLLRYSLDGTRRVETSMPEASHDFWENDDGTFTYISYVFSSVELMPGRRGPVAADHLRTVPEGATDLSQAEEGFDFFEDFPRDPWYPCSHGRYDEFVPNASEWSHVNSLIRSPRGDGWLLQVRFLNAVMGVDGHERLWQAGGDDATLAPTSPDAAFEHGHSSHAWLADDGSIHLLVFDNGDHSPQPIVSRVVELRIDPEGGTVAPVWQLVDPEGDFIGFLGDARRLPNGDTLVVWTSRGQIVEYTPDADVVWREDMDDAVGRGTWVPALDLTDP
jgi:hypothetical protein